jgi:hypothetical protein
MENFTIRLARKEPAGSLTPVFSLLRAQPHGHDSHTTTKQQEEEQQTKSTKK